MERVHLSEIFATQDLGEAVEAGLVKVREDGQGRRIHNYTALAQYEGKWNAVTLACRGLITDKDGYVLARPFAKFFNHSELADLPGGPVSVTDKLDGSLGILHPSDEGLSIATRGSFTSEQAVHASAVYEQRYRDTHRANPEWTYLFEIIYPANRIVVDYEATDDLFLLGAVDTATGASIPLDLARQGWSGPVVEELEHTSIEQALAAEPRPGKEGLVVHFLDSDLRVKIKQDDYVRLHRLITGVSERRIWEALAAGDDLASWLEAVPDEFYEFVSATRDEFLARHAELTTQLLEQHARIVGELGEGYTRKDYAQAVMALRDWPAHRGLFAVLDGKDTSELVWNQLRPAEHRPRWGSE